MGVVALFTRVEAPVGGLANTGINGICENCGPFCFNCWAAVFHNERDIWNRGAAVGQSKENVNYINSKVYAYSML